MKLGSAFSDNVLVERFRSRTHVTDKAPAWWIGRGKALLFLTLAIVCIAVLMFRLFHLTIVEGHSLRALSDGNRTREQVRRAARGQLLDRTGKPLTENILQYRLTAPCPAETQKLCTRRVSINQAQELEAAGLPAGSYLETDYLRRYTLDAATAHVLGYTGQLSEKEMTDEYFQLRKYIPGDLVGRMGAEAVFEERLRGRNGRELVEVDAQGRVARVLGVDREIAGNDVILSLDAQLSEVVRSVFAEGRRGAVVVTRPGTGEIMALYSSPSFSANAISEGISPAEYKELTSDPGRPMFNRAIGGTYPPGSTYKIITSLAALEEGVVTVDTTIEDTGIIKVGNTTYSNWYFTKHGGTDGAVNIIKAIQRSNDTYFYHIGEKLGVDRIAKWSRLLGLGKPLGIELAGEAGGLMPDQSWKAKEFSSEADLEARNNLWYTGDNYNLAIGQGYLLATPLQVAMWTDAVANGGVICKPTIEKVAPGGKKAQCKSLGISQETVDALTRGMRGACEANGTGWPLFGFEVPKPGMGPTATPDPGASPSAALAVPKVRIPVACKTGTAETGIPGKTMPHAWFTVFAPVPEKYIDIQAEKAKKDQLLSGNPEITVTVLVENGGEGSTVAAPIAKKILEEWFRR